MTAVAWMRWASSEQRPVGYDHLFVMIRRSFTGYPVSLSMLIDKYYTRAKP